MLCLVVPRGGADAKLLLLENANGEVHSNVDSGAENETIASGGVCVGLCEKSGSGVIDDSVELDFEVLLLSVMIMR